MNVLPITNRRGRRTTHSMVIMTSTAHHLGGGWKQTSHKSTSSLTIPLWLWRGWWRNCGRSCMSPAEKSELPYKSGRQKRTAPRLGVGRRLYRHQPHHGGGLQGGLLLPGGAGRRLGQQLALHRRGRE